MGSVARADPDGYTLLITTSAYVVNPGLYNSLPYDPLKDFVAIAELASTPNVFAVKPGLGAKTMEELVALAKANPDKFNVSTPPVGTTPYLAIELLKMREGLSKMPILVFTGGGEALRALLGNTVQLSVGASLRDNDGTFLRNCAGALQCKLLGRLARRRSLCTFRRGVRMHCCTVETCVRTRNCISKST